MTDISLKLAQSTAGLLSHALEAAAGPRLSILIFHRVLAQPDPLFPEEIDATRFDRLMALVARTFTVLTLARALALLESGALPSRALVITFDDGYADNAEVALPILQRYGLKASFFVSTGFLDGGLMWNDSVIECLRSTRHGHVDLHDFGLGQYGLATSAERRATINALLPKLKYLSLAGREQALVRLRSLTGEPIQRKDLMMRSEQVIALHLAGMDVGGHTVRHPILTQLADAEAWQEIEAGRDSLQALIDAPVEVFAYPNGRPGRDYDSRHVDMVKRLGFRGAVSTAHGVAALDADRFQLPRFTPWDQQVHRWVLRLLWQRSRTARYEIA